MSNIQLPFERLKGRENFSIWKVGVKAHLITKGLWSYTSLEIKEDTKPETIAVGEKALAEITLSIDSSLYSHVEHCVSAKDAWEALCKAFEDSGVVRKVALLKQWISLKSDNCTNMQEYVNQCLTLRSKVNSAGFKIDEEVAATIMLCGLSDEYKPLVMSVETNGKTLNVDYVKNILLQEIEMDSQSNEKVLMANKKTYSRKFNKMFMCFKCGGPHYQNNCPKKNHNVVLFSAFLTKPSGSEDWFFDSGATAHMVSSEHMLEKITQPPEKVQEVITANKSKMTIKSCGSVKQKVSIGGNTKEIEMTDVQYIPQLCANLLSVSQIVKKNYTVIFNKTGARIINENKRIVATGTLVDNMFKLDVPELHKAQIAQNVKSNDLRLWHRRLGHVSMQNITFIKNNNPSENFECDICIKGKLARLPFNHKGSRATKILELVHSDVCGPMSTPSIGGSRYFVTFIDDFSRKVFVFIIKNKIQAFKCFT